MLYPQSEAEVRYCYVFGRSAQKGSTKQGYPRLVETERRVEEFNLTAS